MDVALLTYTPLWELPGSTLHRDTCYPDRTFSWFPSTWVRLKSLRSTPYPVVRVSTLCSLTCTESVGKSTTSKSCYVKYSPVPSAIELHNWSSHLFRRSSCFSLSVRDNTCSVLFRSTKLKLYRNLIRPILTYGSVAWPTATKDTNGLRIFGRKMVRKLYWPVTDGEC